MHDYINNINYYQYYTSLIAQKYTTKIYRIQKKRLPKNGTPINFTSYIKTHIIDTKSK